MPRKRMLHTKIWTSEQFGFLSKPARLLFIGMITLADDEGKLKGNPAYLKAQIFPYDEKTTTNNVQNWLDEIISKELIIEYEAENSKYLYHPKWNQYQTLRADRIKNSFLPNPPDECQPSVNQVSTKCQPNVGVSKDKIREVKRSKEKLRLQKAENLILKFLKINDIKNKANQQYLAKLYNFSGENLEKLEALLKAVEHFKTTEYPYVIYSCQSLWEKKEKIIARIGQEKLRQDNKRPQVAKI